MALLAYKTQLHGFLQRLTWAELRSGLTLAAMTFIALPLLPDLADPWGVLNLHDLWLFTILIAAVSFAGYAAAKLVGPKRGLVLAAAVGGLITSTATTLSLARLAKTNSGHLLVLAGAIATAGADRWCCACWSSPGSSTCRWPWRWPPSCWRWRR